VPKFWGFSRQQQFLPSSRTQLHRSAVWLTVWRKVASDFGIALTREDKSHSSLIGDWITGWEDDSSVTALPISSYLQFAQTYSITRLVNCNEKGSCQLGQTKAIDRRVEPFQWFSTWGKRHQRCREPLLEGSREYIVCTQLYYICFIRVLDGGLWLQRFA